jgi:hypothetical protein
MSRAANRPVWAVWQGSENFRACLIPYPQSHFATSSRETSSFILRVVLHAIDTVADARLKVPDGLHPTPAGIEAVVTRI